MIVIVYVVITSDRVGDGMVVVLFVGSRRRKMFSECLRLSVGSSIMWWCIIIIKYRRPMKE